MAGQELMLVGPQGKRKDEEEVCVSVTVCMCV